MPPFVLAVLKFALLALLYLFVYRAVRAIVVDLRGRAPKQKSAGKAPRTRSPRKAAPGGTPTKVIVRGGGRPATRRLRGTLEIGRADSCNIQLDDTYVSQVHAKIYDRNGAWAVEDLGSTNGTYLNRRRLTVATEIAPGDEIRIGKTVLEVRA
ncbi:MAG: FHA domain-containing protein FhaB/FipA [Actinomycetota bacterium]